MTSQSGLHADFCEIDQKLQAIVAGRKRNVLQTIQEETGTNIYFPSPLQGLVGPDATGASTALGGTNTAPNSPTRKARNSIWITGEFFGVQRARDMLLQLAMTKVREHSPLRGCPVAKCVHRARPWSREIQLSSHANSTGWFSSALTISRLS